MHFLIVVFKSIDQTLENNCVKFLSELFQILTRCIWESSHFSYNEVFEVHMFPVKVSIDQSDNRLVYKDLVYIPKLIHLLLEFICIQLSVIFLQYRHFIEQ